MGLADTVTKAYMKENTVFADAFNYLVINPQRKNGGEQRSRTDNKRHIRRQCNLQSCIFCKKVE